jgi:hypothetical protein
MIVSSPSSILLITFISLPIYIYIFFFSTTTSPPPPYPSNDPIIPRINFIIIPYSLFILSSGGKVFYLDPLMIHNIIVYSSYTRSIGSSLAPIFSSTSPSTDSSSRDGHHQGYLSYLSKSYCQVFRHNVLLKLVL